MALKDISFFSEDIDFTLKDKAKVRSWIADTINSEGFKRDKELSFVFCSDDYLLEINKEYLNHDTYTDIVTFDSSEQKEVIAGDIFISIERVRENASKFGVSDREELHRVIIHGVLHLCGYYDKKKQERSEERRVGRETKYRRSTESF